jgi:hypothetical protein
MDRESLDHLQSIIDAIGQETCSLEPLLEAMDSGEDRVDPQLMEYGKALADAADNFHYRLKALKEGAAS